MKMILCGEANIVCVWTIINTENVFGCSLSIIEQLVKVIYDFNSQCDGKKQITGTQRPLNKQRIILTSSNNQRMQQQWIKKLVLLSGKVDLERWWFFNKQFI